MIFHHCQHSHIGCMVYSNNFSSDFYSFLIQFVCVLFLKSLQAENSALCIDMVVVFEHVVFLKE